MSLGYCSSGTPSRCLRHSCFWSCASFCTRRMASRSSAPSSKATIPTSKLRTSTRRTRPRFRLTRWFIGRSWYHDRPMNHRVKRNLGLVLLVLVLSLLVGIVALELGALDRLAIRRVQKLAQDQKQEWRNHWLGIPLLQYPSDLFTYQELIASVQPDVIIETGTYAGGSAVYFSMLLDFIKPAARVVTIDISPTL